MRKGLLILLVIQGVYCLLTGLWPLVHMHSFLWVTGPKTNMWLVKMIGLLAVCIGLALLKGSSEKNNTEAVNLLATLSATAFLLVDFYYSFTGVIAKIYLVDGVLQSAFFLAWCLLLVKKPVAVPRF